MQAFELHTCMSAWQLGQPRLSHCGHWLWLICTRQALALARKFLHMHLPRCACCEDRQFSMIPCLQVLSTTDCAPGGFEVLTSLGRLAHLALVGGRHLPTCLPQLAGLVELKLEDAGGGMELDEFLLAVDTGLRQLSGVSTRGSRAWAGWLDMQGEGSACPHCAGQLARHTRPCHWLICFTALALPHAAHVPVHH